LRASRSDDDRWLVDTLFFSLIRTGFTAAMELYISRDGGAWLGTNSMAGVGVSGYTKLVFLALLAAKRKKEACLLFDSYV
jgi:hypothetical protein